MKSYIDKLGLVVVKDRKTLVARSHNKDVWFTPGGKREAGETDEQALAREIGEELTVELKPETMKFFGTFEAQAHGKPEETMVRITAYTADYDGELKPSEEVAEIGWFTSEDKDKTTPTGKMILNRLKEEGLID